MQTDIIIIGGGIVGVSAAYFTSRHASVVLLEKEASIGMHSSSRTAGQYTVGIYAETMRKIASAAREFLQNPPEGFTPYPLISPRGCLTIGRHDQMEKLDKLYGFLSDVNANVRRTSKEEALSLFPALQADKFDVGVYEANGQDIDVDLLLQSYAKGAKANGAQFLTNSSAHEITYADGKWTVVTEGYSISAPVLLNASGAWADETTKLAGLMPIGLTPRRRTAFTFAAENNMNVSSWPHVSTIDYNWYVHPETHSFMGSPVDTVPSPPGDIYPEDLDVAQAIYNIEQDTTFKITRPTGAWAGLRSFVADKNPVLGTRHDAKGFYWLAGHGGCGVLTSPALGKAAAAMLTGQSLPEELQSLGVTEAALAPDRPTLKR